MCPDFIVDRILGLVIVKDRAGFEKRGELRGVIKSFLSVDSGFVSDKSEEFISCIRNIVGDFSFVKSFAVRIRPGDFRLYIRGRQIFD